MTHYQEGEFPEAIEAFEIALQLKPEDPTILSYLQEAHTELETLIVSHLEHGRMLFSQEAFDEARKEYEEILRLAPEHSKGTNVYARIRLIQEGSQLVPEYSSEVQDSLENGLELIKDGDLSTALQHFSELQKTLQKSAKLTEYSEHIRNTQQQLITFHMEKGLNYFITERLEEAIQEWTFVLHLDPSHNQAAKFIERTSRLLETFQQKEKDTSQ